MLVAQSHTGVNARAVDDDRGAAGFGCRVKIYAARNLVGAGREIFDRGFVLNSEERAMAVTSRLRVFLFMLNLLGVQSFSERNGHP